MGITLAAFQFSSSVAALNDKLHIFVSSKATSFDRAFILLGRVPSSWWFITMQFFELFHHSPSLMFLSISPSTIAKGNPSSAMILRINGKLGYFPIKRVGWPRPNVLPLTITERVGNGGQGEPQPSLLPLSHRPLSKSAQQRPCSKDPGAHLRAGDEERQGQGGRTGL